MKYYRIAWKSETDDYIGWSKWEPNKTKLITLIPIYNQIFPDINHWLETDNTTPLAQSMLTPHF